ncbi:polysaccharide deacetylase family protein [Nitratireductor basaltis]|uniref:Chitooligosaccharide deacetylase n=1 Tax=Nitratireductor basaltis TaxID=472175 RepID=A0A084UA86_9HYPH|nr:polysaccharide deacetylase family protein [Nitratireductor basaltis]KFB09872.1 Polysaccharide deacetylase [Nitratireductor basaltis]
MIPGITLKRFMRHTLIRTGLEAIALSGLSRKRLSGGAIIFTLHHVRPEHKGLSKPNRLLSVTPAFLDETIRTCRDLGFLPISLEDLPSRLCDPTDHNRYFVFTLDDGYRNNAEFAAPVFRRHDVPYTIFVTSGFAARTHSIWWETVEALLSRHDELEFDFGSGPCTIATRTPLQKTVAIDRFSRFVQTSDEDAAVQQIDRLAAGLGLDPLDLVSRLTMNEKELAVLATDPLASLGAHTVSHVNLTRVGEDRLRKEILESTKAVEAIGGKRPASFAYPYGFAEAVGDREFEAARDAGYSIAVTNRPGLVSRECTNAPTSFNRVSLNGDYQKARYVRALLSGVPFKLASTASARPA